MPSLIINNTVQMRLVWAHSGTPFAVNVLHGIKDVGISSPTQDGVNALFEDLKTRFSTASIRSQINSSISLASVGLRDLNTANEPEFVSTGAPVAGSGSVELLPLNIAACATLRTSKAGPSYRGRFYMTGYTEGMSSAGMMAATVGPALVAWLEQVQTAMDTAGLGLAVASRKLGVSNAVTAIQVRDNRWDTQRRRIVPGI